MTFAMFMFFFFTLLQIASASEMLETNTASRGNSTSPLVPVESQSLTSFLPTWKIQLEERHAKLHGWMDFNANMKEKILVLVVLLVVVNAFRAWGCMGLEAWREWWEERGRQERFRGWMVEERRTRRESCAVVGILRGKGAKVGVRKRVCFEGMDVDEKILGNGKEGNEMDERLECSRKGGFATKEVELVEVVLDNGFPMKGSQERLTA
jgi:hypothetical protein